MILIANKIRLKQVVEKRFKFDMKASAPLDIAELAVKLRLHQESEEVFILLTFNSKLDLTGIYEVSRGTIDTAMVHPREVVKRALLNNAAKVAFIHNHPSMICTPSEQDIVITKALQKCFDIFNIKILDHVIVGNGTISMRESGLID